MYSCDLVEDKLKSDTEFQEKVEEIKATLRS